MPNDPDLIGHGGGLGRYQGMSVQQIGDRFEACALEPSMRSLSAVLRITREQLDARGSLGAYPKLVFAGVALSVIILGFLPFLPEETRHSVLPAAIGFPIVTAFVMYGAATSGHARRASVAQEREIRRLAVGALERILAVPFPKKPLLREQVDTLRVLLKAHPDAQALRELLQSSV